MNSKTNQTDKATARPLNYIIEQANWTLEDSESSLQDRLNNIRDCVKNEAVNEHAALEAVAEAAAPFNATPFSMILGGNVQGDSSIIYARNGATLTIGDFRRIQEALANLAAIRKEKA